MALMIKHGIRGGISTISNRYGVANNRFMGESFHKREQSSFITYLDANNLYGWAMSKPLPTHGFEWMTEKELGNWRCTPCILEVELEYPEELHELHNDYPLAPESLKLEGSTVRKLIPNLNDKRHYVVHYEILKLYDSYKDIADAIESRFDTSEYPNDHPSGIKSGVNKKVIVMFKDEAGGKQIEKFVRMRAKL